jgi:hypothetical protein
MSDLEKTIDRTALLRRLEDWLASALDDDETVDSQGIAAEIWRELAFDATDIGQHAQRAAVDRQTVYGALTALTQEVKLQGRFFKQLDDQLRQAAICETTTHLCAQREQLARLDDRLAELTQRAQSAPSAPSRESAVELPLILALCDARDRLIDAQRAIAATRDQNEAGFWARLFGGGAKRRALEEATEALVKGNQLAIDRLASTLADIGVQPVGDTHEPLDPQTMRAVDLEESEDFSEGTVLDVYRSGYRLGDQILRVAEVKVATRAKAKATQHA